MMSRISWPPDAKSRQKLHWSGGERARKSSVERFVRYHQQRLCKEHRVILQGCFVEMSDLDFFLPRLKKSAEYERRVRQAIIRGAQVLSVLSFEIIHSSVPSFGGDDKKAQRWDLINQCFDEHFSMFLCDILNCDILSELRGMSLFRYQIGSIASVNLDICNTLFRAVEPILSAPANAELGRREVLAMSGWTVTESGKLNQLIDLIVRRLTDY